MSQREKGNAMDLESFWCSPNLLCSTNPAKMSLPVVAGLWHKERSGFSNSVIAGGGGYPLRKRRGMPGGEGGEQGGVLQHLTREISRQRSTCSRLTRAISLKERVSEMVLAIRKTTVVVASTEEMPGDRSTGCTWPWRPVSDSKMGSTGLHPLQAPAQKSCWERQAGGKWMFWRGAWQGILHVFCPQNRSLRGVYTSNAALGEAFSTIWHKSWCRKYWWSEMV